MSKVKVLVVGSNATRIEVQGAGWGPTGNYLNETVVPIMALIDADYDVQLATLNGTKPHMDKASDSAVHFGGNTSAYTRARAFWTDDPTMNQVRTLPSVIEDGLDNYAGVFVPGGQAPVVDLMQARPDAGSADGRDPSPLPRSGKADGVALPWSDRARLRDAACTRVSRSSDGR
jgi:hypothetical protein